MILPVIIAGGAGTRLWPLSRQLYPKQFLPLASTNTMLQETCTRLDGLPCKEPLVVCGEDHRFVVAEQLRQSGYENTAIILEPDKRNTAPAIALAALYATKYNDDPVLLILPADHVVLDIQTFQSAISTASVFAGQGKLVTFGIVARQPETGYGYIRRGEPLDDHCFKVDTFVEKPDSKTAERYLASGNYYWNSGMFVFRAKRYLDELGVFRPDILSLCEKAMSGTEVDSDFIRPDKDTFLECSDESIDYAVMEKTAEAVVCPMDCGWNDVGSWAALWEVSKKDRGGNTLQGDVLSHDISNCYIKGDAKLVAAVGLESTVIIDTDDALMVAAKDRVQDVKKIVEVLMDKSRSEAQLHRKVYRPWGYYDSVDAGERFQVKRIVVNPGAKLSLQLHHHRAEHWVVVSGKARVTRGEEVFTLSEDESTYIPVGTKHRLENLENEPLEVIEVQSGGYLGEDDIVRFDDIYDRE